MKRAIVSILILALCVLGLATSVQADRETIPQNHDGVSISDSLVHAGTTFLTLDILIDPKGQLLAAYQFELTSDNASFTVVGVEAGDHAAFDHGRPPYFDPVAKQGETDRLILAEYAKPGLIAEQLPAQAVRVATVQVAFTGPLQEHNGPAISLKLIAAGNAAGERIDATASHMLRNPERPNE